MVGVRRVLQGRMDTTHLPARGLFSFGGVLLHPREGIFGLRCDLGAGLRLHRDRVVVEFRLPGLGLR